MWVGTFGPLSRAVRLVRDRRRQGSIDSSGPRCPLSAAKSDAIGAIDQKGMTIMTSHPHTPWRELPAGRRRGIVMAGIVQGVLALSAWRDLARRPGTRVNGPKPLWAAVIAVNFVGPIAYFRWGRRHGVTTELSVVDETAPTPEDAATGTDR